MSYLHFQVYPFHNIRDAGHLENLIGNENWALSSFNSHIQRQICEELVPSSDTLYVCVCGGVCVCVPNVSLKHENINTYMQSLAFQLAVFNHIYLAVITEISMGDLTRYECSRNILNKVTYSFENDRPFKKNLGLAKLLDAYVISQSYLNTSPPNLSYGKRF